MEETVFSQAKVQLRLKDFVVVQYRAESPEQVAVKEVLESFETRHEYLEDLPVADTVLVLQALAGRRGMAAELSSPLLPS